MNANEQLDFYNPDSIYYGNSRHYIQQLEAKVRQQQAEIEALKQIIDANNLNQNIGQFVKPVNEHPMRYLTDEEIGDFEYQIIRACGLSTANSDINPIGLRQIIKAILRKAQEK